MMCFAMEFLFQYLKISIDIPKFWNKNFKAKSAEIPKSHLTHIAF